MVFLSNGPGDQNHCRSYSEAKKKIIENNKPLFGICLAPSSGLANGISTYKMFNGHRGINHLVKNWGGEITSQNHGFAVNKER
jgi:carbamoyl-phosphate synthase small subunit